MSIAEELLESLSYDTTAYTSRQRVEGHIVIDEDRYVTVPEELKRLAVQYDHNVETVTFDCPRYWDDVDMSEMRIYINYSRPDRALGCYLANNVCVDADNDQIMHFDWTIRRDVTEAAGTITFLVCVKRVDEEGNEDVHWNSELCSSCYISKGLEYDGPEIRETYPDYLSRLDERVNEAIEKLNGQFVFKVVSELPDDAAEHSNVIYLVVDDAAEGGVTT